MMNPIKGFRDRRYIDKENERRRYQPWFGQASATKGTCPSCREKIEVFTSGHVNYCPSCGGKIISSFNVQPRPSLIGESYGGFGG